MKEINDLKKEIKFREKIIKRMKIYQKIPLINRIELCINLHAQQLIPINRLAKIRMWIKSIFSNEEFLIYEKILNNESVLWFKMWWEK